jgi:myo-inositol-1(or 4)-monophosphatase
MYTKNAEKYFDSATHFKENLTSATVWEARKIILPAIKSAADKIIEVRNSGFLGDRLKAPRDVVTEGDFLAEKVILSAIREAFPKDVIISEESFNVLTASTADLKRRTWIIDPIDGTVNYAHGLNYVGISVAFAFEGRVQYGIVDAPFLNATYEAILDQGSFKNGTRLQCSRKQELVDCLVATGFPYDRSNIDPLLNRVRKILTECADIRRFGACSIDLCHLAEGVIDAYIESVAPWDMAAAGLIAREAGCLIGWTSKKESMLAEDIRGEEMLVSSPTIFHKFLTCFKE